MQKIPSLLFLLFCCHAFCQGPNYPALLLKPALLENANAVVRLDETRIEVLEVDRMLTQYRRVVTVLNEEGQEHARPYVYYDEGIKVKGLEARVYNSLGEEVEVYKKSDFSDIAAINDFSLYEDSRLKYLEYTPVNYPYTIALSYETYTANTAYLPFWTPVEGYYVSTEKSVYELTYSPAVGVLLKEQNFEGFEVINKSTEGVLHYETADQPAIKREELSPDIVEFTPKLLVAPKNFSYEGYRGSSGDWAVMGKWMYDELLQDRVALPDKTRALINGLVTGVEDPVEKARIVYKYVQENTRYISVQEGIGGIQPISAAEVDRLKYGDCKGLTNYTKALLEAVGVKANYTRVYASRSRQFDVDREFPAFLGQTNHVILQLPQEGQEALWLECTSQTTPFGFLGDFTDNRDVFVITPEGGKIETTPSYLDFDNSKESWASWTLSVDGSLEGEITMESKGLQFDTRQALTDLTVEELGNQYKRYWGHVSTLKLGDSKLQNDKDKVVLSEDVQVSAQGYGIVSGNRILFVPNAFGERLGVPKRYRERKLDFQIKRGFVDTDHATIVLPANYEVEALPTGVSLQNKFGHYKTAYEVDKETHTLKFHRELFIRAGAYEKELYGEYRDFMRSIASQDNAKMVLVKSQNPVTNQ